MGEVCVIQGGLGFKIKMFYTKQNIKTNSNNLLCEQIMTI